MSPAWLALLWLAGPPVAFLDGVEPRGEIRRVVSLAPNLTEIVFALGAGDRLVGVTRYDDFPEAVRDIPRVGGFIDPSVEAIAAARPDLVLCVRAPGGKERLSALPRLRIPVAILADGGIEDLYLNIRALGTMLSRRAAAVVLDAGLRVAVARVVARAQLRKPVRALLVYGHRPLVAAGRDSFPGELLRLAGGENVLPSGGPAFPAVPLEVVISSAPDVIIDASGSGTGGEMTRDQAMEFWNRYTIIPAVMRKKVFAVDSAKWFRLGPRVGEALESLSEILDQAERD